MYVFYGIFGLLYLAINGIITLIWMSDANYRRKWEPVIAVVLILFGLPIVAVVLIVITVMTVMELIRMRIRKEEQ